MLIHSTPFCEYKIQVTHIQRIKKLEYIQKPMRTTEYYHSKINK